LHLIRVLADDELMEVFEHIYVENFYKIRSFCYNYIRDEAASKCAAQEVFITVWENRHNLDLSNNILPYLFVLAKNRCLNILKQNKVRQKHSDYCFKHTNESVNFSALKDSTINKLYSAEIEHLFVQAMDKLPEKVKSTYSLSRQNNYKYDEIAEIQGISIKTVEYRIMYALRVLRIVLKDYLPILLGYIFTNLF